jgi:hypothetical protein
MFAGRSSGFGCAHHKLLRPYKTGAGRREKWMGDREPRMRGGHGIDSASLTTSCRPLAKIGTWLSGNDAGGESRERFLDCAARPGDLKTISREE